MANDTQKEYPDLLCYIKWKSLVNVKCIFWAKSKYLYTSGINSTKGAALACSLHSKVIVVRREKSRSLQVLPGKPWPHRTQLCHPPLQGTAGGQLRHHPHPSGVTAPSGSFHLL